MNDNNLYGFGLCMKTENVFGTNEFDTAHNPHSEYLGVIQCFVWPKFMDDICKE